MLSKEFYSLLLRQTTQLEHNRVYVLLRYDFPLIKDENTKGN
jgi:hypothetical protein